MTQLIEFKNERGELLRGLIEPASGDHGIVCLHGFERTTIEPKFKHVVDGMKGFATTFRFDFSGCGMSDGTFADQTVSKMASELSAAIEVLRFAQPQLQKISVVAHSLAGAVAAQVMSAQPSLIQRAVFLGPAWNQKELVRYYFTMRQHKDKKITWQNFKDFFDEAAFQEDIAQPLHQMKAHEMSNAYLHEVQDKNYATQAAALTVPFLLVQGTLDEAVPPASNEPLPAAARIQYVTGGDHDLQRPDMVAQYLPQLLDFLKSEAL